MKTIGTYLKEARLKKKLTLASTEGQTKIKKDFLKNLERESWSDLPGYATVQGFVKNLAKAYGVKEEQAAALLRRDYPPDKLTMSPKPDVSDKFTWSPRLTFFAGLGAMLLLVLGYLGFQYSSFIHPPNLEISSPPDGLSVNNLSVVVEGKTDNDATIKINNQPVLVSETGEFKFDLEITENTTEIVIEALSRSGKTTEVKRNISFSNE